MDAKISKLVKIAFRKLKAHVYYDKTTLPLRDKVVEFEASPDFEKKLEELARAYDKADLGSNSPIMSEILGSIAVLSFPKKMKDMRDENNTVINIGHPEEKPIVSELQHFIDMDVRGHILGILWIMTIGRRLNDKCFENAFGNRLRKANIWDEDSTEDSILDSPALFEPYFAQYSLWRDGGLGCAENMLNNGHDALIIMIDLTKFYYRVGITKEVFQNILNDEDNKNDRDISIHMAIFSIIEHYTRILREDIIEHEISEGSILPIGFLPSAVLSNWCLSGFDKGILDFWNPSYYGRYVDDIIIVEKIEKGSEIYKKARKNDLSKDNVIDYYLGNGRRENALCFAQKMSSPIKSKGKQETVPKDTEDSPKDTYKINQAFCLSGQSIYEFQSDKTRVIALFANNNNSTALIKKFKKVIYENVSAFRLMPEIDEAFLLDDFSRFYRLDNNATINKLRGITKIIMDKYELSKFLGEYCVVNSLIDDGNKRKFTRIIKKMFNHRELIENYTLWEHVLEIFITEKDYKGFTQFTNRIKDAIKALVVYVKKNNSNINDGYTEDERGTKSTIDGLRNHLSATLNRVLSLMWGEQAKKIESAVCDDAIKFPLREAYINNRMCNKNIMPIPVELIFCPSDKNDVNFTVFTEGFEYLCNYTIAEGSKDEILPYFRSVQDIAIEMLIKAICNDKCGPKWSHKEYINTIARQGLDVPIRQNESLIEIGNKVSGKLKIAVANVSVPEVGKLDDALKGKKTNRGRTRYRDLSKLVNGAITQKADMLVFPENYVPFEWLPFLARKAASAGLAIITGVEHLIVRKVKKVYNYTAVILPFKFRKTIPASAVFFQLKKHYSPKEKEIINGYGFNSVEETEERPLYRWHDCHFPVYCCHELTDIKDRSKFISWADMIVAVEHNKDINYFGSIVESLTRDLHCYCVQVNTSEYGDSRITQPKRTEERDLLMVKGGTNKTLLIGEIDIQTLREFQIMDYTLQKGGQYKPTPPGTDKNIVRKKIEDKND